MPLLVNKRKNEPPYWFADETQRGKKYFLEVPPSRPHTVDDIMHTRITGQHQRWPTDPDTTARLNSLTLDQKDDRPSIVLPLVALTLIIGGLYGLFLLWNSL